MSTLRNPGPLGTPVLFGARAASAARSERSWQRDARRGLAVRLSNGIYCSIDDWFRLSPWDRYLVAALAHALSRRQPPVFIGLTALALHGLPLADVPGALHLRATSAGKSGRERQPLPYLNHRAALDAHVKHYESLGKYPTGHLPVLPDLRRRWLAEASSRPAQKLPVQPSEKDSGVQGTVLADPVDVAMADLLAGEPLDVATVPADAVKRRHDDATRDLVDRAIARRSTSTQRHRARVAWSFADERAESPGESLSRARVHQLGFVVPSLQHAVVDAAGTFVARTDCWWDEINLAGEFDGLPKYSNAYTDPGETWREVLEREKSREDAIRRTGAGMMRWVWKDLTQPSRFEKLLLHHGVPRRHDVDSTPAPTGVPFPPTI
ncbi:hypothetical protein [Citricoccus sp. GCM10030269]|uniref:hypothetical protein n=1 Tax=Citricoccus sp. GCM10030269 TaxID=3273388 RepID=UPI0036149F0D